MFEILVRFKKNACHHFLFFVFIAFAIYSPGVANIGQASDKDTQGQEIISFRYLVDGNWIELGLNPDSIVIKESKEKEYSRFEEVLERRSNLSLGYWLHDLREGFTVDDALTHPSRSGDSFISPLLHDDQGGIVFVADSLLYVSVPIHSWKSTFEEVRAAAGGIASIKVVSSPLGTELDTREYFKTEFSRWGIPVAATDSDDPRQIIYSLEENINHLHGDVVIALRFELGDGWQLWEKLEKIAAVTGVSSVEPEFFLQVEVNMAAPFAWPPNDPDLALTWHLLEHNGFGLNVGPVWEETIGYSSVRVALLDCGVETSHPDLHLAPGRNFVLDQAPDNYDPFVPSDPSQFNGGQFENHATALAGIISAHANNNFLTTGVAPQIRTVPLRVYNYPSSSTPMLSTSSVVNAINWAADSGCRITTISLGFGTSGIVSNAYLNTKNSHDMIHFAASGNFNVATLAFPASSPHVIAVGATDQNGNRWTGGAFGAGSNYGTGLSLMAPGQSIRTTDRMPPNGYATPFGSLEFTIQSGTSASAPMAAALAGLLLSKNPRLSAAEVESAIINTALDLGPSGYDTEYGHGLIQPLAALNAVPEGIWLRAGAVDTGFGWKYQSRFKHFIDEGTFPYYYHEYHGWQYAHTDDPDNFWFYDDATGTWWRTMLNIPYYPYMLKDGVDLYYYQPGSVNPRWFYRVATQEWVSEHNL